MWLRATYILTVGLDVILSDLSTTVLFTTTFVMALFRGTRACMDELIAECCYVVFTALGQLPGLF